MASGLPDYYRGVDVTYQTLAQITNRPKYGGANIVNAAVVVGASEDTELVSLAGKGMIYGGSLTLAAPTEQHNSIPVLEVDGVEIAAATFLSMYVWKWDREGSNPLLMLRYDKVLFMYSVGIQSGITFETGFRLLYREEHGTTPVVVGIVIYALI